MSASWFSISKSTLIDILRKLQTVFDTKADSSHTHTKSDITDFAHDHPLSIEAASTATSAINLDPNAIYKLTAGGKTFIFKTPADNDHYAWADISGKPSSYPPSAHTHTKSQITDFPTIPTVNNGTLTIKKNGTSVGTFTANQSGNSDVNISVPTTPSDIGAKPIKSQISRATITNGYYVKLFSANYNSYNYLGIDMIAYRGYGDSIRAKLFMRFIPDGFSPSYSWVLIYGFSADIADPSNVIRITKDNNTTFSVWVQVSGTNSRYGYDILAVSDESNAFFNGTDFVAARWSFPTTFETSSTAPTNVIANKSYLTSVSWNDVGSKPSTFTPSSHTHGNIQNGGTLQTNDVAIANGDKLVVTDSSDSSKIARASIAFDGSTATKCLTQKGTWENFTNNAGTVTSVKVGSASYSPSSGVVSLPAYPTTLPASDVYAWAKASNKPSYTLDEVTDGSTRKLANYLPLTGGEVTGDIGIPLTRSAIRNVGGTVPAAGTIAGSAIDANTLHNYKTFIGSAIFSNDGGKWGSVISVRHRNGNGDGKDYGFYIRCRLTESSGLIYRQQCGGSWQAERTIWDSSNLTNLNQLTNGPGYLTSVSWNDVGNKPTSFTPSSHTHGNIQNGGTLQTNDITIANGDKLVVTDSSDSSKIARASISFDGSTATKCLTQKGTWESFTNNANNAVTQTETADDDNYYEVLLSGTANNTTRTEGAKKSDKLVFNTARGVMYCYNQSSKIGWSLHGGSGASTKATLAYLNLGNSTASGTAGNRYGKLKIYSKQAYYSEILTADTYTNNRTFTLPDKDGTIALTSDLSSYLPLTGGTVSGNLYNNSTICINSTATNYAEGIRINRATNNYSSLLIGAPINTTSGTDTGAWWIGVGPSSSYGYNLYINRGSSTDANGTCHFDLSNIGYILYVNQVHIDGGYAIYSYGNINGFCYANSSYMEVKTGYGAYGINWWASDTKLKENIEDTVVTALDKVDDIRFIQFDWKNKDEPHVDLGISANQIEEFMPDAVWNIDQPEESEYDTLKNIDTGKMTTYALKAIQELHKIVEDQAKEIAELKERISQ